jgi:PAS domain S-box-containing protein
VKTPRAWPDARLWWFDIDLAYCRPGSVGAYLFAALAVAIATALSLAVGPWVAAAAYVPFILAVVGVTFVSGAWAGFSAIALATLARWLVVTPLMYAAGTTRSEMIARYLVFLLLDVIGVLGISAMRQVIGHMRAMNRTLRTVYDASPDAVLVVDREGRIVDFNQPTLALFGYQPEVLTDAPIELLVPERFRAGHPAHRARFSEDPAPRKMGRGAQLYGRRSDGVEFPADVQIGPLRIGEETLAIAIVRDITQQLALAAALAESQQRQTILTERARVEEEMRLWADAFENSAFGIAIHDAAAGRIRLANGAFAHLLGMTVDEVRGMPVGALYAEAEQVRIKAALDTADRTGHVTYEALFRRKDGSEFPVRKDVTSVREADGTVRYRIASALDLTASRRTELALRQAQKMEAIGNVAGGVAHDFNNLLAVIIGNLDIVAPLVTTLPDASGPVNDALAEALRGADLTQRLLAFARRQPLQPVRLMPNEVVADIARLLVRMLGEDIEVTLDLAPDICPIVADRAQLEASVTNLAVNAREAMPQGGRLRIATANRQLDADHATLYPDALPGTYATIEVSDTGIGMTQAVMSRIFEPFFTTKALGKGTGLGLSMVFGFAWQSGGYVSVYSEPGMGTTVRLYLPCLAEPAGTSPHIEAASAAAARGETVLVVEDNAALRRVVVRQLDELGYRVIEAADAPAALAILETSAVALLFSDIVMPGGVDGFELARQATQRWPAIRVLLTSGFPDVGVNRHDGSLVASIRLLNKPYRKADLARALRDVLDGSRPLVG